MFTQSTTTQQAVNTEEEHTEVRIDALGRVLIEGKNYTGSACSILGDKLRNAFGGGDKADKPEAFAADHVQQDETTRW